VVVNENPADQTARREGHDKLQSDAYTTLVQGLAALLVSGAHPIHGFYDSFAKMDDMARSHGTPTRLTSDHAPSRWSLDRSGGGPGRLAVHAGQYVASCSPPPRRQGCQPGIGELYSLEAFLLASLRRLPAD
jgi:hypothetical protein